MTFEDHFNPFCPSGFLVILRSKNTAWPQQQKLFVNTNTNKLYRKLLNKAGLDDNGSDALAGRELTHG